MLIDTHCHLTNQGLAERLPEVIARAKAASVMRMITIGTEESDHRQVLAAVGAFAEVFGAIGIHPHHAAEADGEFISRLAQKLDRQSAMAKKLLAIGECGLDYHGNSAPQERQHAVFRAQLQLARQLGIPAILHVREAHAHALQIMNEFSDVPFVVHCFTGTPAECAAWIQRGAYIGITGIVTYKNAPDVRQAAQLVPPDHLLVETDAPYLSPEPVRKIKINEPAHVAHVAEFVARLRGQSASAIHETTTQNAARLFGRSLVD